MKAHISSAKEPDCQWCQVQHYPVQDPTHPRHKEPLLKGCRGFLSLFLGAMFIPFPSDWGDFHQVKGKPYERGIEEQWGRRKWKYLLNTSSSRLPYTAVILNSSISSVPSLKQIFCNSFSYFTMMCISNIHDCDWLTAHQTSSFWVRWTGFPSLPWSEVLPCDWVLANGLGVLLMCLSPWKLPSSKIKIFADDLKKPWLKDDRICVDFSCWKDIALGRNRLLLFKPLRFGNLSSIVPALSSLTK